MTDNFKPDETKFGKPVHKPVRYLRKHPPVKVLVDKGTGYLTDLSGKNTVRLDWRLNEQAEKDKVFKLTVDDKVVYLDLEELMYYTRVMFTK